MSPAPGRTSRRRRLLLGLIALLLVADAALVGALMSRRTSRDPAGVFGVLRRHGLAAALDTLESAAREDTVVLRQGHQLAHALGREAVRLSGGDASVIGQCTPVFASGCYHGVVEAFVRTGGRVDMAGLERLCVAAGSDERPGPVSECVHGLGHGVLGAVGDLDATLRLCDGLRPAFQDPCHSGAFMEAISSALSAAGPDAGSTHAGHHGAMHGGHRAPGAVAAGPLAIDPADPYSPCDRYGNPYGSACWLFQGFVILRRVGFDAGDALRVCDGAPAARVAGCYESIGHQVTGLFQRDDASILAQCERGRTDFAADCAGGAARALAQIDWSGARALRLCAASPAAWKETCYRTAAAVLGTLAPEPRRGALCGEVEPGYAETCRRALGGTIFAGTGRYSSVGEP